MALIIPPGYAQVVLNWESPLFDSGGGATVLGFKGESLPVEPEAVAAAVAEATVEEVLPSMSNVVALASVYAATFTESTEIPVAEVGGQNLEEPPPNVTMLIKKVTSARGRRGRGRAYWPGTLGEADVLPDGTLPPAVVTGWQGIFDAWTAALLSEDYGQVVLQNSDGVSEPLDPPPGVTQFVVQGKAATQRRRLRR